MSPAHISHTARKTLLVAALLATASTAGHAVGCSGEALGMNMGMDTVPVQSAISGSLTRAQVQEELRQARDAGMLVVSGDLADSDAVLAARERFNVAQAEALRVAYRVEEARSAALAALRATIRGEAEAAQRALAPSSDSSAQLRLEFVGGDSAAAALFAPRSARLAPAGERWLNAQWALHAEHPAPMLIVTLPGGDLALQQRRAHVLRERLNRLGVTPDQLYFEAGRARRA